VSAYGNQQLAMSGLLKPHRHGWKKGCRPGFRASSARGLFSDEGVTPARHKPSGRLETCPHEVGPGRGRSAGERPPRRPWAANENSDDDDRPRSRRRPIPNQGMGTGAKVSLILGGTGLLIAVVVIAVITMAPERQNFNRPRSARGPFPAQVNVPPLPPIAIPDDVKPAFPVNKQL